MIFLAGILLLFYSSMVFVFMDRLKGRSYEDVVGSSSIPCFISGITITLSSLIGLYL